MLLIQQRLRTVIIFTETEVQLTPIKVGDTVTMSVDKVHRTDVCRNHTATHILDKALRDVLGSHVAQAGSLVESDRLRFDFSHFEAMTTEQIKQAEAIVNEKILESIDVTVQEYPMKRLKSLVLLHCRLKSTVML